MDRPSVLAIVLLALLASASFAGVHVRSPRGDSGLDASALAALSPRALWTNLTPIADAAISAAYPDRNFGAATSLWINADPTNGTASRALIRFTNGSIPSRAQVLNATLRVYVGGGTGGTSIEGHQILAPWSEGNGFEYLYDRAITVSEAAGVARTREPVEARILLGTPLPLNPRANFRVFDAAGNEIPSQITQVASAAGNVTAVTVVFESSTRAFESLTYHVHYGYAFPAIPVYRARTPWIAFWNFTAGTTYASLAAADLDDDGLLETILGSTTGYVYAIRANGSLMWAKNLGAAIDAPVAVADVDGDGRLDVLAMTDGASNHRIYAITWDNRSLWNTGANPGKAAQGPLVVADVNGDGIKEIFAGATDRTIYAFNGSTGATSWTYALGASQQPYGGALANFTGGPAPELIFGTSTGILQALTTAGGPLWNVMPGSNSMLQTPGVADIDGDGLTDIVAGDRAASGSQFAVWGSNGSTKWIRGTTSDQSGGNVIVDFGDDGQLETVFAKSTAGEIGVLRADGSWLWNYTTGGAIYSTPVAADLNGDGEEDIVVGSFDNFLYVIASNGSLIQRIPTDTPVRGTPVIADIDGDGTLDIVFATETRTTAVRTASLGHDSRAGSYNLRNTGHYLDGNSPDGAALLSVSVGAEQPVTGSGVTWRTKDGTTPWTVPGSEYSPAVNGSATVSIGWWVSMNVTSLVHQWIQQTIPNLGLVLRLVDESSSAQLVLGSRESNGLAPVLTIMYFSDSSPRIVSRIPDQVMPEDSPSWTLNLVPYASPPTSLGELSWDLAGADPALYDYTGGNVTGNHQLTFQPKPNAFGNNRVTILIFDGAGRYAFQTMWVNLTPVNDPPIFSPPAAFYVHYDVPYTFNFTPYMSDPDNSIDELYITVSDSAHASVSGHNVTFLYPQSMTDTWQFVTITISDAMAFTARTVAVKVTSDYPPEVIKKLPNQTLQEGTKKSNVFDLDDYFYDRDNDTLFYTFGFTHLNITIHPDHTVDIEAVREWWGIEWVTFRATDPTGALLEDSITVTVTAVNDPPVIAGVPPFVVHFNYPYPFDLTPYISDPDTPIDRIVVSTSDPTKVTVSGRELTLLYPDLGVGSYTVALVINVSDGLANSFALTTVTATSNYPPVLRQTLPDAIFLEDTVSVDRFNLDNYFQDNDSATVFYSSGQVHVSVTIKPDHNVTFSAEPNWNGIETVRFRATDDSGAIAEDTIKVIVQPVNDAPVIQAGDWQDQARDGHSWFLDISAYVSDIEDTNKTFLELTVTSAAGNGYVQPAGMNILFSYPDNVNSDTVTVTVWDQEGFASTPVTIRVQIRGPDIFGIVLPWLVASLVAAATVLIWNRVRPQVEEVFLVHINGLPIAHLSRTLKAEKDTDLVTSMFTAIQNFTDDIFRARGAGNLSGLQLGDYRLSVARGSSAFLVVLYHGRHSRRVERKAQEVVKEVEARFGSVLANWNGAVDQLSGVKEFMEQFFKAKASAVLERLPPQRLGGRGGFGGTGPTMAPEDIPPPPEEMLPPPPPS